MKEFLGRDFSTHEYLRSASQVVLDQYDWETPTGLEGILEKVTELRALEIHGNRGAALEYFPDFETDFKLDFEETIRRLGEGDGKVSGMVLLRAYEHAAFNTASTRQMRSNLFNPSAYGRFIRYFGVPLLQKTIGVLAVKNPEAARAYKEQADKWASAAV